MRRFANLVHSMLNRVTAAKHRLRGPDGPVFHAYLRNPTIA